MPEHADPAKKPDPKTFVFWRGQHGVRLLLLAVYEETGFDQRHQALERRFVEEKNCLDFGVLQSCISLRSQSCLRYEFNYM